MEGQVNGGTYSALVERLTSHNNAPDATFTTPFLMFFHQFSTSEDLFEALVRRYLIEPPPNLGQEDFRVWVEKKLTPIRLRVANTFRAWLEQHWVDDSDDRVLDRIQQFARNVMMDSQPALAGRILEAITKKVNGVMSQSPKHIHRPRGESHSAYTPPPPPILPRSLKRLSFLEVDPLELARQLTIMESRLFCAIDPSELVGQEWAKKDRRSAMNVRGMTVLSTKITQWVAATILSEPDVKRRYIILKHFVKIGDRCLALNNYNTLMAILSALNSSTIIRLKKTWEQMSSKTRVMFEHLREATDHSRNYAQYRAKLRKVNPPCLPFLGLYLTDLTFTEDGNPPLRNNGRLINFDKYVKVWRIIQDLQRFQIPYSLHTIPEIQEWLTGWIENGGYGPGGPNITYGSVSQMSSAGGSQFSGMGGSLNGLGVNVDAYEMGHLGAQDLYRVSCYLEPREEEMDEMTREFENKVKMLEKAGFL
ncbi:hypothetical protein HK104_006452 [Borealophlyctis nickersoniae]|nr:hypothetical protein HK104_006452 [Borealophlyctis nickersoniae]